MFPPQNPNPFGPAANPLGSGIGASNFTPFYQVTPNDKSMADVAANNGLDLNNLVSLNGNTKSLPPVGSYIVTHPAGLSTQAGVPASVVNAYNPNIGLYAGQTPGHTPSGSYPLSTTTAQGSTPLYTHERQKAIIDITQGLASGNLPSVIPYNVMSGIIDPRTGQPTDPKVLQGLGYVPNPITHNLELKNGAGGANPTGGGAGPGNTDPRNTAAYQYYAANKIGFYDQKRWDPKGGKNGKGAFVRIGDLTKQGKLNERTGKFNPNGRNKGGGGGGDGQQVVAPAPLPTSTATASTVLGLHLGSG